MVGALNKKYLVQRPQSLFKRSAWGSKVRVGRDAAEVAGWGAAAGGLLSMRGLTVPLMRGLIVPLMRGLVVPRPNGGACVWRAESW